MFSNIYYNFSSALHMGGQVLQQCSHTKFLGMVIDDKMFFPTHITTVYNNISRNIGFINELSHFIPKKNTTLPWYYVRTVEREPKTCLFSYNLRMEKGTVLILT